MPHQQQQQQQQQQQLQQGVIYTPLVSSASPQVQDYSPAAVSNYPWIPEAARQLGRDLEQLLPEWLIEGMLSEFDRHLQAVSLHAASDDEIAQRPFLFASVDPPKPPPEGSPQALSGEEGLVEFISLVRLIETVPVDVKQHMHQQIEEATRAFQQQPNIDELTGEAVG
ncbi:hypothetical protein Emag_001902 [Eimeria magna]